MPDKRIILPVVGTDWLNGLVGKYIILSMKHSTPEMTMFWRASSLGYTCSLVDAGKYTQAEIEKQPMRYNDGFNAVAIPLTQTALETLGIFTVLADYSMLKIFLNRAEE